MRHGLRVALTVLGFAAPARAADVTVAPAGGEPVTLSIAELEPSWDIRDRLYTLDGQQILVTGISIDRLLDHAGIDPFGYAGATITAAGADVALTREQLVDPAAFPEGRPVFSVDADGAHFLRPMTSAGDPGERISGTLTIALAARGRLRVSATASRRRVETGERIAFSARVEGAAAREDVRVRWTFDDGDSATGTRVQHTFERPGTYEVVVGATSDANPAGASAIVRVRVGEPAPAPDREGGGTDLDADAPDSGAATGSRQPPRPRASRSEPRRRVRANPRKVERRRERGVEVSGLLLDDAGAPAAPAAARTGDPQPASTPAAELPDEAIVALLALAMLALGSWREFGRAQM